MRERPGAVAWAKLRTERVAVPVLTAEDRQLLGEMHDEIQAVEERLASVRTGTAELLATFAAGESSRPQPPPQPTQQPVACIDPLPGAHPADADRGLSQGVNRARLAEESGHSASSSGYANNLGALRSLGLLGYPASGTVVATELLFPSLPRGRTR